MRVATDQYRPQGRINPPTAQSGAKLKGLGAGHQALDRSTHRLRRCVKHNPGLNGLVQSITKGSCSCREVVSSVETRRIAVAPAKVGNSAHSGTRTPTREAPVRKAGAWQPLPSSVVGKTADYTATGNLMRKVLDFVQLGGPCGGRTHDTRIKSPVLCQLS